MNNKAIEKRIASIVQSPELKQFTNRDGKALQINVQILGNDAIDRACADGGDMKAAMKHILSVLPEPRLKWLKLLAYVVMAETKGSVSGAARYLGQHPDSHGLTAVRQEVKAIQNGEIIFQVPEGNEEV